MKVFERIGQTDVTRSASTIIAIIEANGPLAITEVYGKLCRSLSIGDFDSALKSAIGAGRIRVTQGPNGQLISLVAKSSG